MESSQVRFYYNGQCGETFKIMMECNHQTANVIQLEGKLISRQHKQDEFWEQSILKMKRFPQRMLDMSSTQSMNYKHALCYIQQVFWASRRLIGRASLCLFEKQAAEKALALKKVTRTGSWVTMTKAAAQKYP